MGLNEKFFKSAAGGIVATDNFTPITYTGNGGTQSTNSLSNQSGTINFAPDFVWIKERGGSEWHNLFDSVRGSNKNLYSNETSSEATSSNKLTSFDTNGFSLGADNNVNKASSTFVAWNWYAPTSQTNNLGDVTGTIKKNVDAGFSIVKYTASAAQTVGHGLDGAPDLIIKKPLSTEDWLIYSSIAGTGKYQSFTRNEQGGGAGTDGFVTRGNSFPTVNSTVFSDNWTSGSLTYIAYCFQISRWIF